MLNRPTFSRAAAALFALAASFSIAHAQAPAAEGFQEGKNYFLIEPPQPGGSDGKVEVTEIFSYACPACNAFQPTIKKLREALPANATLVYLPASFRPDEDWPVFQRAYYTAQSMGVVDETHQALFDALHRDHIPMRSIEDLAGFYAQQGVDRAKFLATASSFEVDSKLQRAMDIVKNDGIDGTPSIVVDGKYRVTGASAGGYPQMIELVDWLVKKEHDSRGKAAIGKPKAGKK